MQNTNESGGFNCDELDRDSCRPDDLTMSGNAGMHAAPMAGVAVNGRNKRRAARRSLEAVIRVYGNTLKGIVFYEDAVTINVSMYGALLVLNVPVAVGQKLLLFNEAIQRQQVCQVVDIRATGSESLEVAVAFPAPHAEFWCSFPTRSGSSFGATLHAPSSPTGQPAELAATR